MAMQIVMIGSGNVATVLCRLLYKAGHDIKQVFSRSLENAAELAHEYKSNFTSSMAEITADADIYIVAVSDDALPQIALQFPHPNKLVVHTAASVSKGVFSNLSNQYGVLYPLQSLRKQSSPVSVPFLIDGNTSEVIEEIRSLAQSISGTVDIADDTERAKLHVAAVIVSNFTNHLYALAESFCAQEEVDFHLLMPLIEETANRLTYGSPNSFQTGPAIRCDEVTISQHTVLLKEYTQLSELYAKLTASIQAHHKSGM